MSDMTLLYVAAPPQAGRSELPNFGLIALVILAFASLVVCLSNPTGIGAEYQTDLINLI
ncbi:MAG TPA: hypothetical protein VHT04_02360 [Stellaceae bacterium]|jgi:hypothetical protein|nr:hypothetical protein [Stellaceae bacterium]